MMQLITELNGSFELLLCFMFLISRI